jgi:hypothetical protein
VEWCPRRVSEWTVRGHPNEELAADLFANDPEVTGVWTVVSSIGQVTFGLSLCTNHAYLLRIGCTLTGLSSGL